MPTELAAGGLEQWNQLFDSRDFTEGQFLSGENGTKGVLTKGSKYSKAKACLLVADRILSAISRSYIADDFNFEDRVDEANLVQLHRRAVEAQRDPRACSGCAIGQIIKLHADEIEAKLGYPPTGCVFSSRELTQDDMIALAGVGTAEGTSALTGLRSPVVLEDLSIITARSGLPGSLTTPRLSYARQRRIVNHISEAAVHLRLLKTYDGRLFDPDQIEGGIIISCPAGVADSAQESSDTSAAT